MSPPSTAVSAPGKVLLAGGFVVLDRAYTGLVFGLDARVHVHVHVHVHVRHQALSEIVVKSPQFTDAVWEYSCRETGEGGGIGIAQREAAANNRTSKNIFIETALAYALTYIASIGPTTIQPASITILADNDYYSSPSKGAKIAITSNQKPFANFGTPLSKTNKTGLGSSAALVTAFVAALLTHYLTPEQFSVESEAGKSRLHNLAQAAHCAAQGKVGSGFDVASAVYGSCLYRRFSPSILQRHVEPSSPGFAAELKALVEDQDGKWDAEITKSAVTVPMGIRLVMCDVDCGSDTPGMVKTVLAWRARKGDEAERIWRDLQESNEALAAELVRLRDTRDTDYEKLRHCILAIRGHIREMTRESGVPIEPPSQTKLLDECSQVPGVIGGVVPGAGGFDAIALLIEDKPSVLDGLRDYLKRRSAHPPGKEGSEGGRVNLLSVREEMEGVRKEETSLYAGWI